MAATTESIVLDYIARSQRARDSRRAEDFDRVRALLRDDVTVRLAGAWSDAPWFTACDGAVAVIARLGADINDGRTLSTENRAVVTQEDRVFVEQISTLRVDGRLGRSAVGFLFQVADGRIASISTYRNDKGLDAFLAARG